MKLSYLIFAFLLEGVMGKAVTLGFSMSPSTHLAISGVMMLTIVLVSFNSKFKKNSHRLTNPHFKLIKLTITLLILISLVGSLLQVNMLPNFIFWGVWATNLYVFFWVVPKLLNYYSIQKLINIVTLILVISLLGGIFFPSEIQGRTGGIYNNPTTHARMLVLTYLLMFATYLSHNKISKVTLLSGLLAIPMLFLTATRASIFAVMYSSILTTVLATMAGKVNRIKGKALKFVFFLFLVSILIVSYVLINDLVGYVQEKLRIDSDIESIYESARAMNWDAALHEFPEYGFFGQGFLSKFGVTDDNVMQGFSLPKYDWLNANDPLNMILSTAKQQGWLGMFFFIAFIVVLWVGALKSKDYYSKYIAISVLFAGMVWGLADGNWLTTFGDPVDRLSMFILAITLYHTPESNRVNNGTYR